MKHERLLVASCEQCEKVVPAKEISFLIYTDGPAAPDWRFSLLQCTSCKYPMLVYEENSPLGFVEPIWLHPAPPPALSPEVPKSIRSELGEARSCLHHGLHTAAAVMAGRALEGIAKINGVEERGLHRCIEVMAEQGILDGRFVDWARELKVLRNQAAHFTGDSVAREDAQDAVALIEAIATYLFVFARRFNEFMDRRNSRTG